MRHIDRSTTRTRRLVRVLATAIGATALLLTLTSSAFAASGRNNITAKSCQKGGWELLQSSTGGTFAGQDACVAYGAGGGTLYRPSVVVNPTHMPEESDATVTVSGFHANSTGSILVQIVGGTNDGQSVEFLGIPTNGSGGLSFFSTFTSGACATGELGATISFTDVEGLSDSAFLALDCDV